MVILQQAIWLLFSVKNKSKEANIFQSKNFFSSLQRVMAKISEYIVKDGEEHPNS